MRILQVLVCFALSTGLGFAVDVTGKWKGAIETPNGSFETTLDLKAEGAKLTGVMGSRLGEIEIMDGKVEGDQVSFTVVRSTGGNELRMQYKGTATEKEIAFEISLGEGAAFGPLALKVMRAE